MLKNSGVFMAILLTTLVVSLEARTVSKQNSEAFAAKVARIQKQSAGGTASLRTPVTEDELNSWFAYQGQTLLPTGLMQPQVTIVGGGKVMGQAVVDLDAIGTKRKPAGGSFDPFSLLAGKVPVSVTGTLQTRDGMGKFDVEIAQVSGIPIPVTVLQELLSYYSRTPEKPDGVRLDSAFPLPAKIKLIEVGQGQAVVVQ
jgi:hypothetical protein